MSETAEQKIAPPSETAGQRIAPQPETAEQKIAPPSEAGGQNAAPAGSTPQPRAPLEAAIRDLFRRIHASSGARRPFDGVAIESLSAPAFRAIVAERLRSLERDVGEIRSRINGLLFVVAGAVLSQLVLRIFG